MDCSNFREAVSARFDGETLGLDEGILESHLRECVSCRRFEAGLTALARASRLVPVADQVPDKTATILAMARTPTGTRLDLIRALLVGLGVLEIANGISFLTARSLDGVAIHQSRELGAFALGIGVALLVAVVRPRTLSGLFPVLGVLALGSVVTAGIDIASGQVSLTMELRHLIEVISVLAIWMLSRVRPRPSSVSLLAS